MKQFTLEPNSDSGSNTDTLGKILQPLNDKQQEAVTHADGPLLIIAGAGSGKTRVLTYRIAWLLAKGETRASEILALTFTNKAAKEMRERIEKLIGDEARYLWMGTFHSIFARILRYEAELIGYTGNYSIYDTEDSDRVIRQILRELNFDTKEIRPSTIRFKISGAKNQLIDPGTFKDRFVQSTMDDIAAQVYPIYEQRLKTSNAFDFDDLLVKPIELFKNHPKVLEKYQDHFRHILIDEYQDTNHAQYMVTNMLASKHHNISVVGDDAQSIYSFRGADISNILNFEQDYPDARKVALEQNYRSTKAILKAADSVIKQNKHQLQKNLWTENETGDTVTVLESFNDRDEGNRIANYIYQMNLRNGIMYNDIAVLYRTNYQSRIFEDTFRRKGIPYQLVGGMSFYQRKEIKDVVAYLRLLVNPFDEESLLRIINEPARGIGTKTLETLIKEARDHHVAVWEVLQKNDELDIYKPAQSQLDEFASLMNETRDRLGNEPLIDTARFLLKQTGYVQQYVQENSHESLGRRENVLELLNALSFHEKTTENATLNTFLQDISLISDTDSFEKDKPAVTLMTAHSSKGLEFPLVFIAGLEEELFPIGGRNGEETDMEEERRLFYVAVTRAKKHLFLSFSGMRYKFGEEKITRPSRFLEEVDSAILRNETGASYRSGRNKSKPSSETSSGYHIEYEWNQPSRRSSSPPSKSSHIQYDAASADEFRPGTNVYHEKFGKGKVLSKEGFGEQTKVVVFFHDYGQKKLMLKFAKLSIIS